MLSTFYFVLQYCTEYASYLTFISEYLYLCTVQLLNLLGSFYRYYSKVGYLR